MILFCFQINLIAAPLFVVTAQTFERAEGLEAVNAALDLVKKTIESHQGTFKIVMAVIFFRFLCSTKASLDLRSFDLNLGFIYLFYSLRCWSTTENYTKKIFCEPGSVTTDHGHVTIISFAVLSQCYYLNCSRKWLLILMRRKSRREWN